MQDGQRLRRVTDGQVGFLVVDQETKRRSVRLDRGTRLGTDQSLVPYSEHAWEPDQEPRFAPEQIRRICYAADREYRITKGEYHVKAWVDLKDQERIGWKLPADAHAARKRLFKAVERALAGE